MAKKVTSFGVDISILDLEKQIDNVVKRIEEFFRWYNFSGVVAFKD